MNIVPRSCNLFAMYIILVLTLSSTIVVDARNDPYKVLEVPRSASITDIKRNYKALARQWHPDKNTEAEAEAKFIEINKAYELLSDPERRQEYDRFGTTEDTPNFRSKPDYSSFKRFEFDPFESFFGSSGGGKFQYGFNFDQGRFFRKLSITAKAYENNIIPASYTSPQLVLFYGDLCFPCFHAEPIWQRILLELEPLGVNFATIHSQHENELARKLGVNSLPYIVGIVEGNVKHFKEDQLSLVKVIEFVRRMLPKQLVVSVDDSSYETFLSGWQDNRIRCLFVNSDKVIRLRYLLTAFMFRERVACAHLSISGEAAREFTGRYGIDIKMDSLLIFNEYISRPIATLSALELKSQLMNDVLEANKFLTLPRLSSQMTFDQLCPAENVRARRKLCVVLITNNIPEHEVQREAMRQFINSNVFAKDRFRFMYLYDEKQGDFVKALAISEDSPKSPVLHVVVLWRREVDRVLFEWLPHKWDATNEDEFNETKADLFTLLTKLQKNSEILPNNAKVVALIDEQAHGLFGRIVKKILILTDGLGENITRKEILPAMSVALSVGFVVLIGYIMQYLVRMEEESIQERYRRLGKTPPGVPKPKNEIRLNIHELRGEAYNGLIRLLKPGCRTLVVLCDNASKAKLLPKFYRCVFPYRRNKTLMFAFLMLEKNLDWYKKILLQTLGEHRELNINPKNCIGTVIALNGFRKYFCVYHAKHPETGARRRRREINGNHASGAFMGFEETSESENEDVEAGQLVNQNYFDADDQLNNIVFEEHLLDGLPNWLDRLFEGTTQRYHIQYWPDHMK
ncbi:DnaJ -like protein subfamily C member 16 [Halotydeus destructor]|nr:DnaJ -like protein subfamily C member 16 [Halotydeus destructor]